MERELCEFMDKNHQIISTRYNKDNLSKVFDRIDKLLLKYISPVFIDNEIYFVSKVQISQDSIKLIELKMFPVLSMYGYELSRVKLRGKEILKLVEL